MAKPFTPVKVDLLVQNNLTIQHHLLYNAAMITCTYPSGHKAKLRHVTVTGIVVDRNQILLAYRSASSFQDPKRWALPGGYLERDETTAQGVLREVYEETGYLAEIDSLFLITDDPQRTEDGMQNIDLIYLLHPIQKEGQPDHEIKHISWFELGSLPPPKEFAFDHYSVVMHYLNHLKKPKSLPIIVSKV